MDVFEAIEKRTSIRSFREEQIKDSELELILHAAERCPRIGSLDIIVLQDREKIAKISDAAKEAMIAAGGWVRGRAQTPGYNPLYKAPTVIMLYGRPGQPFLETTTGIATGMMIMAATALGLGSVTVSSIRHGFSSPKGKELYDMLGLSRGEEVLLSLSVGYTDDPTLHEMKGSSRNNVAIVRD
ncbi:MAG: nitroreductase family protein [Spirochaetes bacterium]|nr:nitroreductase family protein [Spirochaetota bacterium]